MIMLKTLFIIFVLFVFGECQNCTDGFEDVNGKGCFMAINWVTTSWDHSQELCEKHGGDLAIIDSCCLLGDLARYFHFNELEAPVGYWIGASYSRNESEWFWPDDSEVPMGVAFWGTTYSNISKTWIPEPSRERGENCAMLNSSDQYYFHDEQCKTSANVLCQSFPDDSLDQLYYPNWIEEEDDNSTCPDGFERIWNSCFYFYFNESSGVNKLTNYNDAFHLCQEMDEGSSLAILSSCDLFKAVVDFIEADDDINLPQGRSYWIGGTDQNQEDLFYWIDNTPLERGVPFWGSSTFPGVPEPSGGDSQNCVTLYRDDRYYFHDSECGKTAYPLCQTDLISV